MSAENWGDFSEELNSAVRIPYMKLQPGKNVVRIHGAPHKSKQHWEKTLSGGLKKVICLDNKCPLCALGHRPTTRYLMKVLDKTDPDNEEAKVMEIGVQIVRQIDGFYRDDDYGDPELYDIKIMREGVSRDTKYSVTASPRKGEISAREKEMLDAIPDLNTIDKVYTPEEIKESLDLVCFTPEGATAAVEEDDDFAMAASNKPASSNPALDDWENL